MCLQKIVPFYRIPKKFQNFDTTMERSCSYRWKLEDDPWRESFLVSPSSSSPLEIKRDKTTPSSPFLSILQHLCPFEIEDFPQSSIRLCYEPGRNSLMERTTLSIAGCAPRIFKEATIDDEEISGRGERVFPLNLLRRNLSFLLTVQLLECTCYRLLGGSNVKDDRFVSRWIFLLLDGERIVYYKDIRICICIGIKLYLIFIETYCYVRMILEGRNFWKLFFWRKNDLNYCYS